MINQVTQFLDASQKNIDALIQGLSIVELWKGLFDKVYQGIFEMSCNNPTEWTELQEDYFKKYQNIVCSSYLGSLSIEPSKGDRRFNDSEWKDNPFYNYLSQSYLLNVEHLTKLSSLIFENASLEKFMMKAFLDAVSPSNFPLTNPEVMRQTLKEGGENFTRGFQNFLKDQQEPKTFGLPSNTNFDAFEVGKNLATSIGGVIFENDLCQLIYYSPLTKASFERPILFVPPWINKYYILDLSPHNSFVRWNLEQGRSVYMISWINPKGDTSHLRFHDYIFYAIDECIDVIRKRHHFNTINLLGFCISGVAVLSTLAYYAAQSLNKIESATLLATPVDFSYLKEFSPFVAQQSLNFLEQKIDAKGFLPGEYMVKLFYFLRSNDLIWNSYVNHYLLGKSPPEMDFLYWNNDTTNLPGKMHLEYLKTFFIGNALINSPFYELNGIPVELEKITNPLFFVGCKNDHIVPWLSAFGIKKKCPHAEFVLAGSGHIAGILNPPHQKKYGYWTNICDAFVPKELPLEGSWWTYWNQWIETFSGQRGLTEDTQQDWIEPAPGRYVKETINR